MKTTKRKQDSNISNQVSQDIRKVKQDGLTLQFVKNQTEEICLESLIENGIALLYIKRDMTEGCLEPAQTRLSAIKRANDF